MSIFRATPRYGRRAQYDAGIGCKLNADQVREIRSLAADPDVDQAEVARRFGISTATVYSIWKGRRREYVK